jgi:hypothetical protein
MHPLVARIHPSIRTSLTAWLLCRLYIWSYVLLQGGAPTPSFLAGASPRGAPLWVGIVEGADRVASLVGGTPEWWLAAAGELVLLAGAVAVYRFARKDDLPHTAERATWLWMATPAAALTLPVSAWNFAAAGLAVGLANLRGGRFGWATLALVVAVGFRPESLIVGAGTIWMAWRVYKPAKQPSWGPWVAGLAVPAAFTLFVGIAILLAGSWGISIRTLQTGAEWRTQWPWPPGVEDIPFVAAALGALIVLILFARDAKRTPLSWVLVALPPLVWPLLHDPVLPATGTLMFAVPGYVLLARALDDRRMERPVLTASLVGLLLCLGPL